MRSGNTSTIIELSLVVEELASIGWDSPATCELEAENVLIAHVEKLPENLKLRFLTDDSLLDDYIRLVKETAIKKYGYRNVRNVLN